MATSGYEREVSQTGPISSIEDDIRARVHELLIAIYPPGPPVERRRDRRYPYPRLIRMTPVAADGRTPSGASTIVVGSTLSERGLGFFHPRPLADRRMICSFDAGSGRWLGLLIDLTWCRFSGIGWYESGGRFLDVVSAVPADPKPLVS